MIVGNGLIAKNIAKYDDENIVFFASGVSNSQEVAESAFNREHDLLQKHLLENAEKLFIYFSTYSINDPSMQANPYILHKIAMEHYIATTAKTYLIIRTSNLIGETSNPNTIANYLRHKVASGESFECWNIQRNLLNISHLCKMTNRLIEKNVVNDTVYLVNPIAYTVVEIVSCFEQILQKKANYTVVNKGANFDFPTDLSQLLFDELHISTEHYLQKNLA